MGIHDRVNPFSKVVQITDLDTSQQQQDNYTSDDASSIASAPAPPPRTPRRSRNGRFEALDYQLLSQRLQCKSRRHAKRHHHLAMVKTLVGLEEAEIESECTRIPDNYGHSIFSSLFSEAEKMQAWNSFIEMSEEDQMLVIDGDMTEEDDDKPDEAKVTLTDGLEVDKRTVHPSYSSETCFLRIDQHIKTLLNKRHLPLGLLEGLELEMRSCFQDCMYSVYEVKMETGFGRLLLHALAQYLGLDSYSFMSKEVKHSAVVCKNGWFSPPPQLLSSYLDQRLERRRY